MKYYLMFILLFTFACNEQTPPTTETVEPTTPATTTGQKVTNTTWKSDTYDLTRVL